jgi:hypothetical protein
MRGKPLRGGSMSSGARVCGACLVLLTGIWLGGASARPAWAAACPNAQFRSGPSERLPDCRAYEQVSPADKGGQDAVTLQPMLPAQASACEGAQPCAIAYINASAAFAGDAANEYPNAYVAARSPSGWQTTPVSPPTLQAPASGNPRLSYAFSEDLSLVVLRVPLQQLTEAAPAGVYNLYLRQPSGAYSLLTTTAPPEPPQAGCGRCFEQQDVPAFAGASSDFSHVIFEANDSLVAVAPGGGVENLYEAAVGQVRLVGILPDETIPAAGATAGAGIEASGEHASELQHAISQDGSRALFEATADGGIPDEGQRGYTELYDRIDGSSTVEVSAPMSGAQPSKCETQGAVCNAQSAQFWAASANGSSVYFTSKAALTKASYTGPEPTGPEPENPGNDLYRYDVNSETLTDLTPDAYNDEGMQEADGAGVLGVVGASEDGSYVYFVAEGHLADGALGGQPNLYVWHEAAAGSGNVRFIATLAAPNTEEQENIETMTQGPAFPYDSDVEDWSRWPSESQAYVTPDGRHLAFMSVKSLTGYENTDGAGEAVHEVFEYSAESGQLLCASCDPSGARPLGSAFIGARLDERASTAFHQPRSLSDDGSRLFFSSPDALTGGAGGSMKLFEYESGTIQLISGAEAGGEAVFLDASASGNDVFFATRERLAPTDTDELLDVYDARVDGGLPAAGPPASCEGATCQEPLTAPPSLTAPLSASFSGSGNLIVSLSKAPVKSPVKLARKQLLARALAKCRKLKSRRRRLACVALAKRRYESKPKGTHRAAGTKRPRS